MGCWLIIAYIREEASHRKVDNCSALEGKINSTTPWLINDVEMTGIVHQSAKKMIKIWDDACARDKSSIQ